MGPASDSTIDLLDPLTGALRARRFELMIAGRIASPIKRKAAVIAEVRALTGIGRSDAKHAVEQQQIIFDSLTPDQAERMTEQLAAVGGNTALSLARAHLYAYSPKHPRRGDQACERLTVVGQTLELARGHLGAWTAAETQVLPVEGGDLLAAIDRQRASWAAKGLREASSELELLQRVSARNEELEARIAAAEGEALVHEATVYGDWLQNEGDPRGHVASLATSLHAAQLAELVRKHGSHLLGHVRPLLDCTAVRLDWVGPMITKVVLGGRVAADAQHPSVLERLLALPACADLRSLALRHYFAHHPSLGEMLTRSSCASSLRELSVTQLSGRASFVDSHLERLEELRIDAHELAIDGLSASALRRLSIELPILPTKLEPCLIGLDAPALEHFDFFADPNEYWDHHSGPLQSHLSDVLQLPAFARLRSLTLRMTDGSVPFYRGFANMLARLPAMHTLECVDLRLVNLAPEARAELAAMQGGPQILLP